MSRTAEEQQTLDRVMEMYHTVLVPMDASKVDDYISPEYIQHSPNATPGPQGLKDFLNRIKVESPDAKHTFLQTLVDGKMVMVRVHVEIFPGTPGIVAVDLFRVEGDMIVEHWETIQEVPAQSTTGTSFV